ncbi:MAG: hypothetical protein L3J82_02105, partial [Planctomycetes bacterium]|nr:hypothetical protein [Planctomycetota bacterium]
ETASVEQATAPVRMENRVAIQYNSGSGEGGSVLLGTWIANAAGDYYWITIVDQVSEKEPDLGGLYSLSALKNMDAKASNGDAELDVAFEGLESNSRFNFVPYGNIPRADEKGEKFQFVTKPGYGFLLSSRAHGDYRLSKKARGPITHSTGEGDMQVRCLNISKNKSVFEVSRWVESEGKWYLAVLVVEVGEGKDVGSTISLGSSVDGLSIYDEKGSAVSKGPNVEVDLTAGAFGGINNRMVSMGDTEFDVFGVLFK